MAKFLKFVIVNFIALLTINVVVTEPLDENEIIESRFIPYFIRQMIERVTDVKCTVCRMLFYLDCDLYCLSSGAGSATTVIAVPTTTTTTTTLPPAVCPDTSSRRQFVGDGSKCYYYLNVAMNWDTARRTCIACGMHLATLTTANEGLAATSNINNLVGYNLHFWVGFSGTPPTFTNTLDGSAISELWISDADKTKACGTLKLTSAGNGFNTADCTSTLAAFCEADAAAPCPPIFRSALEWKTLNSETTK